MKLYFINFVMFQIKPRYSAAVEFAAVNPFNATAVIRYTNGYEYLYSNVSRAKLLNLMFNDNMSLGFWIRELSNNAVRCSYTDRSKRAVKATGVMTYEFVGCTNSAKAPSRYLTRQQRLIAFA